MTKKIFIISSIALLIGIGVFSFFRFNEKDYTIKVYQVENGWGYDILLNKKALIHQEIIPAIAGQQAFPNKKSAKAAASLVVEKLEKNKIPGLSAEEVGEILEKYR